MAPNLMPPVISTESEYRHAGTKPGTKTIYTGTQKKVTEAGMEGPGIVALDETSNYDLTITSGYITQVLRRFKINSSYGILAGIQYNTNKITATFIFGLPGFNLPHHVLHPTPYDLPILIRDDYFLETNGLGTTWSVSPVYHADQIMLEPLSVGLEGDLAGGGSFAGFLWKPSSPQQAFGLTAAHCVPGAVPGMVVSSPSTLEITSRLDRLVRYTQFAPSSAKLRQNTAKESETVKLLQEYTFQERNDGVAFTDPGNSDQTRRGVFNGPEVGRIVSTELRHHAGLLYRYDQELMSRGLRVFEAKQDWQTRLDYCIFSCHESRYGGNIYEDQFVATVGDLYPDAIVEKIGRSTGVREGKVNGVTAQKWNTDDQDVTHEIAIMGRGGVFATTGDSGGCVFVKEGGIYKAAGVLIGRNNFHDVTLVTPLRLILASAGTYEWA